MPGAVYLAADEIRQRVAELGAEISAAYRGGSLLLVSSVRSSIAFLSDLSRAITIPHELDLVALAAYHGDSDGQVQLVKDLETDIRDRDVLLVQDVVDTGLTLRYLIRTLELRRPASLAVAVLLDRPYRRLVDDLPLRHVGFTAPDEYFVGYGFGLDGRLAHLPELRVRAADR